MSRYEKKMADKNRVDFIKCKKIFLDDYGTYVTSTGKGTFAIVGNGSKIDVDKSGNIAISGTSVRIDGKNFDFSELPDRYIRPSGISWQWIANNTEVFGVIPIRIGKKKVFIPFIGKAVD